MVHSLEGELDVLAEPRLQPCPWRVHILHCSHLWIHLLAGRSQNVSHQKLIRESNLQQLSHLMDYVAHVWIFVSHV